MIVARSDILNNLVGENGAHWEKLEFKLYCERQRSIFDDVRKLMVSADPSCYQGQSTMAAIIYSFEKNAGASGIPCIIPAGKHLNPTDKLVEMRFGPVQLDLTCPFCRYPLSRSTMRMLSNEPQ